MSIDVPFYIKQLTRMLEIIIEMKRNKMIALGIQYGLTELETVQVSEELDQLIILYHKIVTT
ncbi:Spo0E family sporulation regulatory protein-aspartic acid phosphatase [Neobacillus sp. NRS-1170]|uniref:Spo0E family sporulation regulatory protein-aspartic acid phosphatase n=1 Tax=Neobacillus sp. NRS-1170 TaxID=3233898 RepID=UPI003D27495B